MPKPSSCSSPGASCGSRPLPTKVASRKSETCPGRIGVPRRHRHLGVEVGLLVALGHRAHRQRRIELGLVDLHALGLARRRHGDAAGDRVDRLEAPAPRRWRAPPRPAAAPAPPRTWRAGVLLGGCAAAASAHGSRAALRGAPPATGARPRRRVRLVVDRHRSAAPARPCRRPAGSSRARARRCPSSRRCAAGCWRGARAATWGPAPWCRWRGAHRRRAPTTRRRPGSGWRCRPRARRRR